MWLFGTNINNLKSKGEVTKLIKLSNSKNRKIRLEARIAIVELGGIASKELCKNINDVSFHDLLVEIGEPSINPLIEQIKGNDPNIKAFAAIVLEKILSVDKDGRASAALKSYYVEKEELAQREKDKLITDKLNVLLDEYNSIEITVSSEIKKAQNTEPGHGDYSVWGKATNLSNAPGSYKQLRNRQSEIIKQIGDLGPRVIPAILPYCIDKENKTTDFYWGVLCRFDVNDLTYLTSSLNEVKNEHQIALLISRIKRFDDISCVPVLIQAMKDKRKIVRLEAAEISKDNRACKLSNDSQIVKALINLLDDKYDEICRQAAWSLGLARNIDAVDPLIIQLSKDRDNFTREYIIESLGRIGDPSAIKSITSVLLNDQNEYTRIYAVQALGNINDNASKFALIQCLEKEKVSDVIAKAIDSLLGLGIENFMKPVLLNFIENEIDEVREKAKRAIRILERKEMVK